jgi:hypothetical protein
MWIRNAHGFRHPENQYLPYQAPPNNSIHVRVRYAYLAGQGSGRVSRLSAIAVATDSGCHEKNSGSLHRHLA